jgi:hypothetical protein
MANIYEQLRWIRCRSNYLALKNQCFYAIVWIISEQILKSKPVFWSRIQAPESQSNSFSRLQPIYQPFFRTVNKANNEQSCK